MSRNEGAVSEGLFLWFSKRCTKQRNKQWNKRKGKWNLPDVQKDKSIESVQL